MAFRVLINDKTMRTSVHAAGCRVVVNAKPHSPRHAHDVPGTTAQQARDLFMADNDIVARGLPRTTICRCAMGH